MSKKKKPTKAELAKRIQPPQVTPPPKAKDDDDELCQECGGTGEDYDEETGDINDCEACEGTGYYQHPDEDADDFEDEDDE